MKSLISITTLLLCVYSVHAEEKSKTLTLKLAKKIAVKAESHAKKKNWKMSIAIVNSEGNLMYFQRDPEAFVGSIDASIQKAQSSNDFQRPTSAFVERVKQGSTGIIGLKNVVALEGGVPIMFDGKFVGAIGVSGAKSTEDEETAKAALE